jgi:ubiquinone/menaquinone biosynthesis C-methylase UbiE/uncharacterized protein YbaR (Trm112 family)
MTDSEERSAIIEDLERVKYVGSAKAEQMIDELGISSVAELAEAAREGKLSSLQGIGKTTADKMLASAEEILEEDEAAEEQADEATEEAADEEPAEQEEPEQKEPDVEEPEAAPRPRIERFIERIRCPACGHDSFERESSTLTCTACKRQYNITDGIADLAPPDTPRSGLAQKIMESGLYSRVYEKHARPKLTSLVSDRTMNEEMDLAVDYLELSPETTLLDVACGTGNFTRYFAQRIGSAVTGYDDQSLVVGMDISWAMLQRARSYLRRDGVNDRVFLLRGDATRIPLGRATFDRVHCAGGLHLMDDIDEALRHFARVLEPGGICVVSTFLLEGGFLKKLAKRAAEVPTDFHWFGRDELHERMERAGFKVVTDSVSREAITVKAQRT